MAKTPPEIDGTWIITALPIFLIVLVAVHVFALAFWIYRLVVDSKRRTKPH